MNAKDDITLLQHVQSLSRKELGSEIKQLYRLFPSVQEYYQSKLNSTGEGQLLSKYKNIITNEFMPARGFGKARLSVARKAMNDFYKLSKEKSNRAEMMVHYVEMGVQFTIEYGDIDEPFYSSMESMYDKACNYVSTNNLETIFLPRLKKIVDDTDGMGWGFHDTLTDIWSTYFPVHEN